MRENKIISTNYIAPKIKQIVVHAENIAQKQKPGQFIILRINESGERVPFTIVDSDLREGSITLIIQDVGKSTHELCQLEAGDFILDIVGPLGKPSEIENFGHVVVIGGGVGSAVSYPIAKALKAAGNHVTTINGARTKELIILEDEMCQVSDECFVTTDDGSYEYHGFVTNKLQDLIDAGAHFDHALAIGPLPMMRAIAELTRPYHISTMVSLNSIMVDGTGMCGSCRVTVGGETRFTCVDGPEFDGHLVDFDQIIKRNKSYLHEERCALDESTEKTGSLSNKERMQIPRQSMPERDADIRKATFDEVNLGFHEEIAIMEAQRCLHCKKPACVEACPVGVKIPQFIRQIEQKEYLQAAKIIQEDNVLAKVCGRVCPQSDQCEGACILNKRGEAVSIGALERFVSDFASAHETNLEEPPTVKSGRRVAVIGSGPAGLSCAGDLIREGHEVTVFEAFHEFGGVLIYGIPEFRLPKEIVRKEVDALRKLGVEFKADTVIGSTYTIDELMTAEGFDAVFISIGAGLPKFMNIPGENLIGVLSANEFLTRVNLMKAYQFPKYDTPVINIKNKHVAVIGGGNTALDSARISLRLGAKKVNIIYRRTEVEMPARVEEIKHAKEEGIQFNFLNAPVALIGNEQGWLTGMRLIRMELGEKDASGRRRPEPITDSEYELPIDMIVIAIGSGSNPTIQNTTPDLEFNKRGNILVDEQTMATNKTGVYAGGDIVTGGATVILAMGAGRKAATSINNYLHSLTEQKGDL